jgi:amino acid transporter
MLQFSRIMFSTARDESWPGPINRALSQVHPTFRSPWVATLIIGGIGTILTFFGSAVAAITFTSVLIIINYALIAIAAVVHRFFKEHRFVPYQMKLWPLPPIIGVVGVVLTLYFQARSDVYICIAIFVVGLLLYFWAAQQKTGFWSR